MQIDIQMKKLILLSIFTFLVIINARTQSFEAGIKTGMGISTFSAWKLRSSGGEDIKQLPVACFELGLTGKYQFSELLGIKAGLEVIGKGEGLELAGTDITGYKGIARINYLIVPVMATVSRSFGDIVVFGQL